MANRARGYGRITLLAIISVATPSAQAQPGARAQEPESFVNQQRTAYELVRGEFDRQMGAAGKAAFDWGGWYSSYLSIYDDGVESSRTYRRYDLRLWSRWTVEDGAHEIYLRTRTSLVDFNSGDSYDGNDDDVEGPNLERGFYRLNLNQALRAYGGRPLNYELFLTAGRDLVEFGTGLALSAPLDHVMLDGVFGDVAVRGLAGKTFGSSQDFDLSRPSDRTRRNFLGWELVYRGWQRHRPFAYAVWQRDQNSEWLPSPLQDFDYDSSYFGVGSTGEVVQHLRYSAELVYESGKSTNHRWAFGRSTVDAWAADLELEYLFPGGRQARVSAEYLFGSGDGDRLGSPTNTIGGNRGDFHDTSFIGFGYRDTGLSFAPRYSNLHMWRIGGSLYPWPEEELLRRLELGSDWFLYYKHHRDGAVSDPTADERSGYLGWEMDYYANWRMTVDFAWTVRIGTFFPGDAFSDQTTRTYLLLGMVWSF